MHLDEDRGKFLTDCCQNVIYVKKTEVTIHLFYFFLASLFKTK